MPFGENPRDPSDRTLNATPRWTGATGISAAIPTAHSPRTGLGALNSSMSELAATVLSRLAWLQVHRTFESNSNLNLHLYLSPLHCLRFTNAAHCSSYLSSHLSDS